MINQMIRYWLLWDELKPPDDQMGILSRAVWANQEIARICRESSRLGQYISAMTNAVCIETMATLIRHDSAWSTLPVWRTQVLCNIHWTTETDVATGWCLRLFDRLFNSRKYCRQFEFWDVLGLSPNQGWWYINDRRWLPGMQAAISTVSGRKFEGILDPRHGFDYNVVPHELL